MVKKSKTIRVNRDFVWFSKNFSKRRLSKYSGKWIAIKDKKVLSSGKEIKEVMKKAKKKVEEPILVKIPKEREILIL